VGVSKKGEEGGPVEPNKERPGKILPDLWGGGGEFVTL